MVFDNGGLIRVERMENMRVIVNLVNVMCNLIDMLNGLDICEDLGRVVNSMLSYLLKQNYLSSEHKEYMIRMKTNPFISGSRVISTYVEQHEKRLMSLASSDDFSLKI